MRETERAFRWKRAVLTAGLILGLAVAGAGYVLWTFRDIWEPSAIPEQYQVMEEETGTASSYMLNITDREAIGLAAVDTWLAGCDRAGEGFQCMIYSDPDSWDAFFYLPKLQEQVGDLTNRDVTISVRKEDSGCVLCVYLHTRLDMTKETMAEEQLLHFVAPVLSVWPNDARVYLDGKELPRDGMSYDG